MAAFVLQDRFMDLESKDSVLDLDYSDINPDLKSDLFSVPDRDLNLDLDLF